VELREQHLTLAARCAEARANWEEALAAKDRAIEQLECALSSKEEALVVGGTSGTTTIRPNAYETAPKLRSHLFEHGSRRSACRPSRLLQSNNTPSPASRVDSRVRYVRVRLPKVVGVGGWLGCRGPTTGTCKSRRDGALARAVRAVRTQIRRQRKRTSAESPLSLGLCAWATIKIRCHSVTWS